MCLHTDWGSPDNFSWAWLDWLLGMDYMEVYPASHSPGTTGPCRERCARGNGRNTSGRALPPAHDKAVLQVSSPNISLAEASHIAEPKSKGAWRYTTAKVGRQRSKYLPSNNPEHTKGFTEEVSLDLGLEGEVGFFQVNMD